MGNDIAHITQHLIEWTLSMGLPAKQGLFRGVVPSKLSKALDVEVSITELKQLAVVSVPVPTRQYSPLNLLKTKPLTRGFGMKCPLSEPFLALRWF